MIRLLGSRGASAVAGFFMLALASAAPAQVSAAAVDTTAAPLGSVKLTSLYATKPATSVTVPLPTTAAAPASAALLPSTSSVVASGTSATSGAAKDIAREASWLHRNGWPLYALVDRYGATAGQPLDDQANCIAVAVYHEARGESLEGQLAVARVIMNRAASGKYPSSWCGTVKQPWQFSFVNPRSGHIPYIDQHSASWRKAVAITRLAVNNVVPSLSTDVLWYHADYVAPSWGRRLNKVSKIGTHIFYRS